MKRTERWALGPPQHTQDCDLAASPCGDCRLLPAASAEPQAGESLPPALQGTPKSWLNSNTARALPPAGDKRDGCLGGRRAAQKRHDTNSGSKKQNYSTWNSCLVKPGQSFFHFTSGEPHYITVHVKMPLATPSDSTPWWAAGDRKEMWRNGCACLHHCHSCLPQAALSGQSGNPDKAREVRQGRVSSWCDPLALGHTGERSRSWRNW